jgi:pyruvate/2-oxoglutarate dehydrogenase complex dihydrolipoamide dehydrogenase (E3) component
MEAAMTAAARGHKVTLYDRGNKLGGKLLIASIPPYKGELQSLVTSLSSRAWKAGVEIKLKSDVTPTTIEKEKPDVLIMATGSSSLIPNIPGIAGPNVMLAEDVLTGAKNASGNVLIVGGGMVGCETAEFLLERGKGVTQVTVIEMLSRMADNVSPTYRPFFLARLKKAGIKMDTNTIVQEITKDGVKVEQNGVPGFIRGDAVVLAAGFKSNPTLDDKRKTRISEVYAIGDCAKPRMIKEAIEEGFSIGRKI